MVEPRPEDSQLAFGAQLPGSMGSGVGQRRAGRKSGNAKCRDLGELALSWLAVRFNRNQIEVLSFTLSHPSSSGWLGSPPCFSTRDASLRPRQGKGARSPGAISGVLPLLAPPTCSAQGPGQLLWGPGGEAVTPSSTSSPLPSPPGDGLKQSPHQRKSFLSFAQAPLSCQRLPSVCTTQHAERSTNE